MKKKVTIYNFFCIDAIDGGILYVNNGDKWEKVGEIRK